MCVFFVVCLKPHVPRIEFEGIKTQDSLTLLVSCISSSFLLCTIIGRLDRLDQSRLRNVSCFLCDFLQIYDLLYEVNSN